MEIKPQHLSAFLQGTPPAATLFYGVNRGLVRESATFLVGKALGGVRIADAPFGLARLTAEQVSSGSAVLADLARAISFDGSQRVLWIEGEAEKCVAPVQRYLAELEAGAKEAGTTSPPPAILVAEGGGLRKNHKLVQTFAKGKLSAVAACYADEGRAQESLIDEYFSNTLPREVRGELVARLSPDRMLARRELEKLVLLAGDTDKITAEQVLLAVADNAESDFDDLCYAITAGRIKQTHEAFRRLAESGTQAVAIARIVSRHLLRLAEVRVAVGAGVEEKVALRRLVPPVFWKREQAFRTAQKTCPPELLDAALATLLATEAEIKSAGAPFAKATLERTLLGIARKVASATR